MHRLRHDWQIEEVETLWAMPFNDLLFQAHKTHRDNFPTNRIQTSTLLSIKTGGCSEDCGYCSQSARHDSPVQHHHLLPLDAVTEAASTAKAQGATRFCMGAAWRNPADKHLGKILVMIQAVKALGMETCMTLGMLTREQAQHLKQAGLDYYNHNLDTSPEFYAQVVTTHTYQERLNTLENVRSAGIKVCSGGIVGMGENRQDRAHLLLQLANLAEHPESVPINNLVAMEGTPLTNALGIDPLEFVRTVAVARILMPKSWVRLSAGRKQMSDEMQAWCFFAGANSIFYGDKLLTTDNPSTDQDQQLFARLGLGIYATEYLAG